MKWANVWLMEFNLPKCNILQIATRVTKRNFTYKMNYIPLNTVLEHDYLGVRLHHKLSWRPHFDHICNKASRLLLGFLKWNLHTVAHQYKSKNIFTNSCSLPLSTVQPWNLTTWLTSKKLKWSNTMLYVLYLTSLGMGYHTIMIA